MKNLTLESAQRLIDDPEAIKRGYLSQDILHDAEQLAQSVIQMPDFGKIGYLVRVGFPENYWLDKCPGYESISQKYNGRQHCVLIGIAEEIVADDRREIVESRWASLEIIRKRFNLSEEEREEYLALSQYLNYPAKS